MRCAHVGVVQVSRMVPTSVVRVIARWSTHDSLAPGRSWAWTPYLNQCPPTPLNSLCKLDP